MKKILPVTLVALVAIIILQKSASSNTSFCVENCPKAPYSISNPISRGLQYVSGLNFLASKLAESKIQNSLEKSIKGNISVDIDSFSAFDLASGKLKAIELKGQNIEIDNMYFSSLEAKTLCDFIHIDYNQKPASLVSPLVMRINGSINEADLNKTVTSQRYQDFIQEIKVNGNAIGAFSLANPSVKLQDNRIILNSDIVISGMPQAMAIPLTIDAALKIINDKIVLGDIKLATAGYEMNLNLPENILEKINPVLFGLYDYEVKGRQIKLQKVAIKDGQIDFQGDMIFPGNPQES